jgi:hypothetical protein
MEKGAIIWKAKLGWKPTVNFWVVLINYNPPWPCLLGK